MDCGTCVCVRVEVVWVVLVEWVGDMAQGLGGWVVLCLYVL